LETALTAEQRKYAFTIRDSAEALLLLINDVLDISKLEAGKVELEALDFALADLLDGATALVAPAAADKHLELTVQVDPTLPANFHGDAKRLRQVLLNLLSNAVKFTERGAVRLAVDPAPPQPDGTAQWVHFAVTDTGPGITAELQPRLFRKFSQGDSSITRRYGGTGLGLAICHELVELMGGEIGCCSPPGGGTTFWFAVPLVPAVASLAAKRPLSPERLRGRHALVIDDVLLNIEILTRHLTALGIAVAAGRDAAEAVTMLERAARHGEPYDVVLIDRMMPGMDGIALAQRLRSMPEAAGVKFVLVSSAGYSETRKGIGTALDAVLEKPIRPTRLLECLAGLFSGAGALPESPRPAGRRALHLLLAEDNKVNRLVTEAMLHKGGHSVRVVADGIQAVNAARTEDFDIVLMDVQMPLLDGIEATRRIRALSGPRSRVPVVALTADAMHGAKERYLQAGMDDYLAKPFGKEALLDKLASLLGEHRTDAALLPETTK
jgi:CheY-like chemotaxis protein